MKTEQELIDEVMDEFDYDRVQKVMEFLDWTWVTVDGVLTISDLKRRTRKMLSESIVNCQIAKSNYTSSTGGFTVEVEWDKVLGGIDCVELRFVLEHSLIFNN